MFPNLSGMPSYKKVVARVFVKPKFSDLEADLIIGSQVVPACGDFIQLFTADGGATLTPKRTASKFGDQQRGNTEAAIDIQEFTLEINVAQLSLDMMQDLLLLDPSASTTDDGVNLVSAIGTRITDLCVSFFVYDKDLDPNNDTNTPDIDCDGEAWVILKACPSQDLPQIVKDNKQGTAKLSFDCLMSKSTGAASGKAGRIGAFTASA